LKFAVQENLVSGESFGQKAENLSKMGYQGMELRGDELHERVPVIKESLRNTNMSAACIVGGYKFGLLFPDPKDREQSVREIKELLDISAELGAEGVIIVPIFHGPRIPDLSPWKSAAEIEEELLVEQLTDLAAYAGKQGAKLILEPLNRFETHYVKRLDQAVHIYNRINSPHLTVLADFFHMNIEEADISQSIRETGNKIGYVHLADSNRLLPGLGHTNFKKHFEDLTSIDYDGWMSLECTVPKDDGEALKKSLDFMKRLI